MDKGLSEKAYKIIKQFFGSHKCTSKIRWGIIGKIIMENRERLVVWIEYIEELYKDDSTGMKHKTPEVENGNQD